MNKLRKRYIFDIVLSILLIVEMFFELTGDLLHELLGCIFFITIIAHLILSRKWMKVTANKIASGSKMKRANALRLILAIGLAISFAALMASSIAISMVLIDATGMNLTGSARQTWIIIHTVSSYALCAFTIAHVLVHWASICSVFKIPYNPARRQAISTGASAVVAVSAIALGVAEAKAIEEIVDPAPLKRTPDTEDISVREEGVPLAEAASYKEAPKEKPAPKEGVAQKEKSSAPSEVQEAQPEKEEQSAPVGNCTLCKLRCPLSAPQCNRPYQAGLI